MAPVPKLLTGSLKKLYSSPGGVTPPTDRWVEWFSHPQLKKGRLLLVRGGEDSFSSHVLKAELSAEGKLSILVDRLLPDIEVENGEIVHFHAKLVHMDAGIECTTIFRATLDRIVEVENEIAVSLKDITDLEVESEEYLATLGQAHKVELGFIWFGSWIQVPVLKVTVSRLMFDVDLLGDVGLNGYAVPKASLKLESGGAEVPVRLQLFRRPSPQFEAKIEKIDSLAQTRLTAMIEEIWATATGMQKPPPKKKEDKRGYISKEHDALADAFRPHILYLGDDTSWKQKLSQYGVVMALPHVVADQAAAEVQKIQRCDLVIGDADRWGEEAIKAERMLRSWPKVQDAPRIWLQNQMPAPFDLCEYGAYEVIPGNIPDDALEHRIDWAVKGDRIGKGIAVAMVTANKRLRYRVGLALSGRRRRLLVFEKRGGLLTFLDTERPMWVFLDIDLFMNDLEAVTMPLIRWAQSYGAEVIFMARGVESEKVIGWLKLGVKDIIVLDPALHQATQRILDRVFGKGDDAQ